MTHTCVTLADLRAFEQQLHREEKSVATIEKYMRDTARFFGFADGHPLSKELTVSWKQHLQAQGYALRSINSMLASLNSLLRFLQREDCKVKLLRCQRQTYCAREKELTREEYLRLLDAAGRQTQLQLVIKTICGTGIRISELKFFTVEGIRRGVVTVRCKNKTRSVLIPGKLKKLLLAYATRLGINTGLIFTTRSGNPLDRSNLWAQMKGLCKAARVNPAKVFPHNLRKLFARTFYRLDKDIAKLADALGHSSIDTTRIYIMTTDTEHRKRIEQLGLVV